MTSGFFNPQTSTDRRIADAEAELKGAVENERPDQLAPPEDQKDQKGFISDTPPGGDGTNWQKRYGDLQRYIDKKLKPEYQTKIDALTGEVTTLKEKLASMVSKSAPTNLPETEEDILALQKDNPAAFGAIMKMITIQAEKIVQDKVSKLDSKFAEVETVQTKNRRDASVVELKRRHPDLDDIAKDEQFHIWIEGQSKTFQDAIFNSTDDIEAADAVLTMYKTVYNIGKKKPKKKNENPDVDPASQPSIPDTDSKWLFTESQIAEMDKKNPRWFDQNAEAIEKALKEGKVLMDISDPRARA